MKSLIILLVAGLVVYGVYAFYYYFIQRAVIYPRHLVIAPKGEDIDLPRGVERIWLTVEGKRTECWYLPPYTSPEKGRAPLLIYAHANAELIDYWPEQLASLRELGMGVLLVEYPGYGRSEGDPTQGSITEAMTKAFDAITARDDVDKDRVVVFGRSLGGGAACALAAERKVRALVLMSTFTSIREMAGRHFLPGFLMLDPFNNLEVVREFTGKILVIHGLHDEIFPFRMGEELASAARDGELLSYRCGHNDCVSDWNLFWREQEGFFRATGVLR